MLVYSADPYTNSRVDVIAQGFLNQLGMTNHDFMIIEPYSIGDAYHTLSLMQAFREKYLEQGARLFFLCQERVIPLVSMFNVADVSVNYSPNELLCEFFANRYHLSTGVPIVMAPDMHANGWLGRLCGEGVISSLIAKKLILELDLKCPIHHAVVPDQLRARAEESAKDQGVQFGKSLIIFNHANTCVALSAESFQSVVRKFPGPVFTDVTIESAVLIPGTRPIKIPLDQIIPMAEVAGNVLALRSGIVDILSNARTKLFTIYPRVTDIPAFFSDPSSVIKAVRNCTLAKIGLSDSTFETAIFLGDDEGDTESSEHMSRECGF